jgi:hypothetical protein
MTSTTLAPGISRLHSLRLPIASAGIGTGFVSRLVMGRMCLVAVGGLDLIHCQIASATVHCCYAPDDKDNSEETEDQDVEHDLLHHAPLRCLPECPTHAVIRDVPGYSLLGGSV